MKCEVIDLVKFRERHGKLERCEFVTAACGTKVLIVDELRHKREAVRHYRHAVRHERVPTQLILVSCAAGNKTT